MGVLLRKISPYSTHLPTKCVEVRLPPPSSNHIILMNINELKILISVLTKYLLCILKIFNLTDLNWCLEFIIRSFVDKPGSSPPYLCFVVFFLCLASWTWISHLHVVCRGDGKRLAIGQFYRFFRAVLTKPWNHQGVTIIYIRKFWGDSRIIWLL